MYSIPSYNRISEYRGKTLIRKEAAKMQTPSNKATTHYNFIPITIST